MSQRLHTLLRQVGLAVPPGLGNVDVDGVSCDSRRVGTGTVFVGLPGATVDGGAFWPEALQAGAALAVIGRAAAEARPPADGDAVLWSPIRCPVGLVCWPPSSGSNPVSAWP